MKGAIHWVLVVGMVLGATTTEAQVAVFDAANLGQNALTAAHTLEQINNQVIQLQHEATMLLNEARNLTTLPFNIVGQLQAALALTTQLLAQAQGIPYQLSQAQSLFARFYPTSYGAGTSGASMAADSLQRWLHSLQALQTTISMQAQSAQNLAVDTYSLGALVDQSQSAIGILQATNATNQLLALQSRQSIQEQQLRMTQDRGVALEQARAVAEEARSREVRIRFVDSELQYSPQPVSFYGF